VIKKSGMPITGSRPDMRPKKPVKTNANNSSAQAEQQIKEPPQPFANKMGGAMFGAPQGPKGAVGSSGIDHTTVGAKALPPGGPVGQRKPINNSKQVGGRFGTSHPKKVGASPKLKKHGNASFYGEK
jgi:hypothetical protein